MHPFDIRSIGFETEISQADCERELQDACLNMVWMNPALVALMVVASGPF